MSVYARWGYRKGIIRVDVSLDSVKCDARYMIRAAAFLLVELSGSFTILWVPFAAYGMLGMYKVAARLQKSSGIG